MAAAAGRPAYRRGCGRVLWHDNLVLPLLTQPAATDSWVLRRTHLDKIAVQNLLHKLLQRRQPRVAQQARQVAVEDHLLGHAGWRVVESHLLRVRHQALQAGSAKRRQVSHRDQAPLFSERTTGKSAQAAALRCIHGMPPQLHAGLPPRLVSSSEGSGQCRLLGGHQSQRRADRTQPGGTQRVVPVQAKLALVPGRRTQCHVGTVSWQDPSLGGPRPPRVQLTELAARAPHPHGGGPHPMMLARERVKRATSSSGLKV